MLQIRLGCTAGVLRDRVQSWPSTVAYGLSFGSSAWILSQEEHTLKKASHEWW